MKLSTAIRLGAMLHPQGFGDYIKDGKTCALGAAREAGYQIEVSVTVRGLCPVCHLWCYCLGYPLVTHLNDQHKWTREQIADLVEIWETEERSLAHRDAVNVANAMSST